MNLSKTNLPPDVVAALRRLNIREVESLLSIVATPTGALAIARVLGMSVQALEDIAEQLKAAFPGIEVVPATAGPIHAMGHIPPAR